MHVHGHQVFCQRFLLLIFIIGGGLPAVCYLSFIYFYHISDYTYYRLCNAVYGYGVDVGLESALKSLLSSCLKYAAFSSTFLPAGKYLLIIIKFKTSDAEIFHYNCFFSFIVDMF